MFFRESKFYGGPLNKSNAKRTDRRRLHTLENPGPGFIEPGFFSWGKGLELLIANIKVLTGKVVEKWREKDR